MKKIVLVLIVLISITSCSDKQNIIGNYIAQNDSAFFESIEFNGEVATFGDGPIGKYMPAFNYEIKDNILYIETHEGIMKFEIINNNTIRGMVSIIKNDVYKKQ